MTKKELLHQYRIKYGWEMPTKKLARIAYNENSILFPNLEAVRLGLMRLEGKGMSTRYKPITNMPTRPKNPYNIPQIDRDWETVWNFHYRQYEQVF